MNQQYENDYSLLRPFDLEKAKQGAEIYLKGYGSGMFIIGPNEKNEIVLDIEQHGFIVVGGLCIDEISDVYMKPLCWLEGKPVYKGDELWSKVKGLEDWNYIVDKYVDGSIVATEDSTGFSEYLYNLSWTKQEDKKDIPEALHDPKKFKLWDKVKIVRCLPEGDYSDKGWRNDWTYSMDKYVGEEFVVKGSDERGVDVVIGYSFPSSVMELVEAAKEKPTKLLEVYLDGELIKQEYIEV